MRISRELADDMLTDAIETVSCVTEGWGRVWQYQWRDWPNRTGDDALVFIRESAGDSDPVQDDTRPKEWTMVTRASFTRALETAMSRYPHLFTSPEWDGLGLVDLDYDATSADVVLQLAVLGEVVYG